jgi:hypothetical protein
MSAASAFNDLVTRTGICVDGDGFDGKERFKLYAFDQ